jgi:hypothetical protein
MLTHIFKAKTTGAVLSFLITLLIIFFVFNRHILEANEVSFAAGGDGLKSTFCTLFHIQYDTSYWFTRSMNHPYGESIFFTDSQPFQTNFIKVFKGSRIDFSGYAVGILNIWLLFSFVLCSLFLYLIMIELKLPPWLALAGSIIITFLTPQWDCLSGHYSMGYAYIFPFGIWLLIKFYQRPSYLVSIIFGLFIFIICGKHFYFIALVGIVWLIFWIFLFINGKSLYGKLTPLIPHLFIQLIIPFIVFSVFSGMYDPNTDRTEYPWGFPYTSTRLESVFLPLGKSYGNWIHIRGDWRTVGYVGLVSTLTFILTVIIFIRRWIRDGLSRAFRLTDNFILNVLFLAGFISLLISLGFPFVLGMIRLMNYMGPLRQLRTIGRFIFPFFYIINVYSIYILWKWYGSSARKLAAMIILPIALIWMSYDAFLNVKPKPKDHYNKFPALNDRENILPENNWVKKHNWNEYQAIMPFPYFHIGSENYWKNDNSPIIEHAYIASLKTGLPLNAVMLSRTSIHQTLNNLDLYYEPCNEYPVLKDLQNSKPYLLMRCKGCNLTDNEWRLIHKSTLIDSSNNLYFYRFYPDSLEALLKEYHTELLLKAQKYYQDKLNVWYFYKPDSQDTGENLSYDMTRENEILTCLFPDSGKYIVSFWFEGANRDLWPVTYLFKNIEDSTGHRYFRERTDFFREMIMRDNDKGLVEFPVYIKDRSGTFHLTLYNRYVIRGTMNLDKILIRRSGEDVVIHDGEKLYLNNRRIFEKL